MPDRRVKDESFATTKELVEFMNRRKVTKDDVFTIFNRDGYIFLIYLD